MSFKQVLYFVKPMNNVKNIISENWLEIFGELRPYSNSKLYKIIGPLITGVELIKLPSTDCYRPHLVVYPLWKLNEKECFKEPFLLKEIVDEKGEQYNLAYSEEKKLITGAAKNANVQSKELLNGDVKLSTIYSLIDETFNYILVKSSPVAKAKLFELKLCTALYINDEALFMKTFNEVTNDSQKWTPELFNWKFGNVNIWLEDQKTRLPHKVPFLNQIESNKTQKKIQKLIFSEIAQ